jgi:methyltransferase
MMRPSWITARDLVTAVAAFGPLAGEAILSARNARRLRARGAIEPPDDVYAQMSVAYPAAFAAMWAEGWWRRRDVDGWFAAGCAAWALSKALKYWAIRTLGDRWSFHVQVLPGAPLIRDGPYRLVRHPNYLAVVGELGAVGLLGPAPVTGTLSILGFTWLLRQRIAVEERALGIASGHAPDTHPPKVS